MATTWNKTNPSCVITWFTLALLDQSINAFPKSGSVKMKSLLFWAGTASMRTVRAKSLAIQLRGTFTEIAGAEYEEGFTSRKALKAIREILLADNGNMTMADLAKVHDKHFKFIGEEE